MLAELTERDANRQFETQAEVEAHKQRIGLGGGGAEAVGPDEVSKGQDRTHRYLKANEGPSLAEQSLLRVREAERTGNAPVRRSYLTVQAAAAEEAWFWVGRGRGGVSLLYQRIPGGTEEETSSGRRAASRYDQFPGVLTDNRRMPNTRNKFNKHLASRRWVMEL